LLYIAFSYTTALEKRKLPLVKDGLTDIISAEKEKKSLEVPGDWEQDMEPRPSRPRPRFWEENYGRHNVWF
jgi:hypothetical protein